VIASAGHIKAKRTYGVIVRTEGARGSIITPGGGSITRVGDDADPIIRIKSESTGNPVLKRQSELRRVD